MQPRRNVLVADERWLAALLSCALNLAGCWFLLRPAASPEPQEDPVPPVFFEVVFVERTVAQEEDPPALPSGASITVDIRQKRQRMAISELSARRPPKVAATARLSDPMSLDLAVPHVPIHFAEYNPFDRSERKSLPTGTEFNLKFADRSLGGALQRMSRNGACRQLRMALASQSASVESILATMRRYGCGS